MDLKINLFANQMDSNFFFFLTEDDLKQFVREQ